VQRFANLYLILTGGSSGIGRETAVELARRGARVIIASRRKTRGDTAVKSIIGMALKIIFKTKMLIFLLSRLHSTTEMKRECIYNHIS